MENTVPKKQYYSTPLRIIAAVLTVALLLSMTANGLTRVRIRPGEKTEAATNYLVDNTGYVNEGRADRLQDKLQTFGEPTELEDYYRLAGTQIAEEDYSGALESIEACLARDPETDPALTQDLLMKKGCLMVLLENYPEALTALDQVIEMDPSHSDAFLVKAQIYAQQEDMLLLTQALEGYLNLCPEDGEIRLVLAQTYFTLEWFEMARDQYGLLQNDPNVLEEPGQIQYLYALTNIQLGDFVQAEESLLEALSLNEQLDGIYYYLGVCQMAREAYAEAVDNLTRSLEKGSMVQLSSYSRGVCGLVIPDYDLTVALTDLQSAAEYTKEDVDPAISKQAANLITQLTTPPEETQSIGS